MSELKLTDPKAILREMFDAAVAAAQPESVIKNYIPERPTGRTIVLGAGKASAQMARAFENAIDEDWRAQINGLIVTQYGAGVECTRCEVLEAAHPVPDEAGFIAAQRLLELAQSAGEDDLVVALISGGGSSLLPLPAVGLTLEDEQAINRALLASGAPISKMNVVRKAFSQIKGGRFAAACHPAKLLTLVLSDVPGDDPAMVASGPTIADENGLDDARAIVQEFAMTLPKASHEMLFGDALTPPPLPTDPSLANAKHAIIASAGLSLNAAQQVAEASGVSVEILGDDIEGEARDVGAAHAQLFLEKVRAGEISKPHVILSGGETTVTLGDVSDGKGGRCTEYLLALAIGLTDVSDVYLLSADTDGRDGSEQNAGAYADGTSVARLAASGHSAEQLLQNHQAFTAFEHLDDLLNTGPTGTNVNDFRAILWI